MELKRTTKIDGKLKNLHFEYNDLVDENGEIIELEKYLRAAYGDRSFDLSVTAKDEEIIEVELTDDEDEE
jgi:hypothetical protein